MNNKQNTIPFLEKLLDGAEVEWKKLGEVAEIIIGEFVHKNKQNPNAKYPVYNGGITPTGYYDEYNNTGNKIIVSARGANAGFVNRISKSYWAGNSCYSVEVKDKKQLNWIYAYYYLKHNEIKLTGKQQIGSIPAVSKKQMEQLQIPIPPLHVQKEIVRILDNFTQLTVELEAELTARKKQYECYRDNLLSFDPQINTDKHRFKVEWKTLGEVGEFIRGSGLPKTDFTTSGVPAIHYGQIYTYYGVYTEKTISFVSEETAKKLKKVNKGDVIITNTSENIEDVGKAVVYLGEKQAVTGGHASIFKPSETILGKYFAYFTQTNSFFKQKRKLAKGTKVIDVSAKDMMKIKIPIPPIKEQERIVKILDKFDTLTNSISEGLPKEIELRKKQYTYYRDKLLTFATTDEHG